MSERKIVRRRRQSCISTSSILNNCSRFGYRALIALFPGPMRPHLKSLCHVGRLRAPGALSRCSACPPHMLTANVLRTVSLHSKAHRTSPFSKTHETAVYQKRWITQQHLQRVEEGKLQWARWAKEIKEGKRQSFVQHLESRGLIHDVVGCASLQLLSFLRPVGSTLAAA